MSTPWIISFCRFLFTFTSQLLVVGYNSIKFNINYDVAMLQEELLLCVGYNWVQHFNQNDYEGCWQCISLRSVDGCSHSIVGFGGEGSYRDTPLLDQVPYMRGVIEGIPGAKESIRLMALYPGAEIKPHKDRGCAYADGVYRIHIPISTNPAVEFYLEGERIVMEEGSCWYLDFSKTHQIINRSDQVRVHLVIDGLRDEDTDSWFMEHGYEEAPKPDYDEATKRAMIAQLEMMEGDGARQLVLQLKRELKDA